MNSDFRPFLKSASQWRRVLVLTGAVLLLLGGAIACRTVNRTVVQLPEVPGAKYIGSRECEQCHQTIYREFVTADHSRLITEGPNALNAGCESCHGPASLHSESGGETKPPFSFSAGRPPANSFAAQVATTPARTTATGDSRTAR